MPITFGEPEYWRERAEVARRQAEQMDDPEVKEAMLAIAANYEKIARRAEATQTPNSN
jgi:hypothetical protein